MNRFYPRLILINAYLALQECPLPLETMSQFAEPVIPDESACGGRDPESSVICI